MPRSPTPEHTRDIDREKERERAGDRERERDGDRDRDRARGRNYDRDYDYDDRKASSSRRDRDRDERDRDDRRDRDKERERYRRDDKERDRDRDGYRDKDKDRDRDRERRKDKERERDRYDDDRRREKKAKEKEKRRDSRSPSPSARQKRKAEKAAAKAAARREIELQQSRALAEISMYSATDNPFHDANLGEQFQWHKKREKEKKSGLTTEEIARRDAIRRLEAKEELERLNKKRADREAEMALRDEEEQRMKRLAEDAMMAEWHAKEGDFELEQARRRAGIRLRMQRAKAIDFLAINLRFADASGGGATTAAIGALTTTNLNNPRRAEVEREEEEDSWGWADAGFEFEIDEPWKIFDNLTLEDCEELKQDINMYLSLEKSPINIEFWQAMQVVCDYHLNQLRDPDHAVGGRLYNSQVEEDTEKIVSGLSLQKLNELEDRTKRMLSSGQPIDGEFWDLVLKKITVQKAIAKLNSIHEIVLMNRLEQFKRRQREDAAKVQAELVNETSGGSGTGGSGTTNVAFGGDIHADGGVGSVTQTEEEEEDFVEDYDPEMSPPPVDTRLMQYEDRKLPIVDETDMFRELFVARHAVSEASFVPKTAQPQTSSYSTTLESVNRPSLSDLEAERQYRLEAMREANDLSEGEEEEEFGNPEDLDLELGNLTASLPANYDYSDRYRPRKPRYFNRVHTGYEWSSYNQTHYDSENPPPKVVQGYKFNIFYPDLIDKTKAPTYYFKRIPDDPDTHIIVFTAGPPYEDIAFRIVRRPWEYSHRRGFRSNFDRGVLQLYFRFSRQYYKK